MAILDVYLIILIFIYKVVFTKCDEVLCNGNGRSITNDTCECFEGWQGPQCQYCSGKVKLTAPTGTIYDGPGNYSVSNKCSWLIEAPNSTITLHIEEFATESLWDNLYIFDGDSVQSPLLAVFSGNMYKNVHPNKIQEVVAQSGYGLIYFFSDDAASMEGFNITYRLNSCPSIASDTICSGNGLCIDTICSCSLGWKGIACHLETCPGNCSIMKGHGICNIEKGCECSGDYLGDDCSQTVKDGYWEILEMPNPENPFGSASHTTEIQRSAVYVLGGEHFNKSKSFVNSYNLESGVWESLFDSEGPSQRYDHSTVTYDGKIFLYGGILQHLNYSSEVWAFLTNERKWEKIKVSCSSDSHSACEPYKIAGHTTAIVTNKHNKNLDKMVVIFGYSPELGFLNTVQEYYFVTNKWYIITTKGYPVEGGYGCTATWDPLTEKIYVYGGITVAEDSPFYILSDSLYSYEPHEKIWTKLADAPSKRFLHTASVVSPGQILVTGGNTLNNTSSNLLMYDILCDNWSVLDTIKNVQVDLSRYGHSAVVYNESLFIYGGFYGQMLSDWIKFTPGGCQYSNKFDCLTATPGVKCVWNKTKRTCLNVNDLSKDIIIKNNSQKNWCSKSTRLDKNIRKLTCHKITDCQKCLHTSMCTWHVGFCVLKEGHAGTNTTELNCYSITHVCNQLQRRVACTSHPSCTWNITQNNCRVKSSISSLEPNKCPKSCSSFGSCANCTEEQCVWCQSVKRCVDTNAYVSSFPYGQCREWISAKNKCLSKTNRDVSECFYNTCEECTQNPACGWCDDGSNTGLGTCMPGGYWLTDQPCSRHRWYFTSCPKCQCNGHAQCYGDANMCTPCGNFTSGKHCEECIVRFFGNPKNGGICKPCSCNGNTEFCDKNTGRCICETKGVVGKNCEKCDITNHYEADPYHNNACYYELAIDYQYSFNLSKALDKIYNRINLKTSLFGDDEAIFLNLKCSKFANVNITVEDDFQVEYFSHSRLNCTKDFMLFNFKYNVKSVVYIRLYNMEPRMYFVVSASRSRYSFFTLR